MAETPPIEDPEPIQDPVQDPAFSEIAEATEPAEPSDEERLEMAQARAAEMLALEGRIPVPKEEEEDDPEEEEEKMKEPAVEESLPEPKPKPVSKAEPPSQQSPSATSGEQGQEGGFDREASRTKLRGTIRRRGESSLEVEDTVKGRFFAEVNREIEKAWQNQCILHRQHILPGVISLTF